MPVRRHLHHHKGPKHERTIIVINIIIIIIIISYSPNQPLLQADLEDGEDIARCATCSLILRVIYSAVC